MAKYYFLAVIWIICAITFVICIKELPTDKLIMTFASVIIMKDIERNK